jgi:hypothetical protein
MNRKDPNALEGMRVKLINMIDDPNPIPSGTEGTIRLIDDAGIIHVNWDNGRRLGLIPNVDEYELEPGVQDFFDTVNEGLESNPRIKNSKTTKAFKSSKLIEKKGEKKSKKNKKEIKETGVGAMGGGVTTPTSVASVNPSGGMTTPLTGTGKKTWGKGPLTKTGVSKPGPLKKKKKVIEEITNSSDVAAFDDTRFEAWSDKNRDGWKWNDKPAYHKEGKIIDPLAKIEATWDDQNLDISKEWDKTQLTKEDFIKIVKTRLNEVEKDKVHTKKWDRCVKKLKEKGGVDSPEAVCTKSLGYEGSVKKSHRKKEEKTELEETTTFGSVWGSNGPPVGPAFAAKQGQWRTGKNPLYKGGKIVQRIENSGVLNPINEANPVKYHPKAQYVKIKKKCTKYPYCSQGAIDKPLNISNKMTEPGTYVEEQLMRNIHEVAKMTGKSFQEVYNTVKKMS